MELDPGKAFSCTFSKDQEQHLPQADWFWIYGIPLRENIQYPSPISDGK
jgi:hypothetical protein